MVSHIEHIYVSHIEHIYKEENLAKLHRREKKIYYCSEEGWMDFNLSQLFSFSQPLNVSGIK